MNEGGEYKAPPCTAELLQADDCRLFKVMAASNLILPWCKAHAHAHMVGTTWTQGVINKTNIGELKVGVDSGYKT